MLDEVDEVYISTFSADQNIRVSAERLELEAVSGEISIAGEYDHVQIETVSGDVRFGGDLKDIAIDAVSANVELSLHERQANRIHLDAMSGNLRVILPKSTTGFRMESDNLKDDVEVRGFTLERRGSSWGDGRMRIDMDGVSSTLVIEKRMDE